MATKTSFLELSKPAYTDAADIAVINANMDLIDAAVGKRSRTENVITNGYFFNPINQRGNTSVSTSGEFILDRWKVVNENDDASGSVTWTQDGVTLTPAADSYIDIRQREVERYDDLNWQWHTLAIEVNDTWETVQMQYGQSSGGTAFPCGLVAYHTWGMGIVLRNPAGGLPVTVQRIAYYKGMYTADNLPAYEYKGYAAELAECRRYYENSWFPQTTSVQNQLMGFVAYGSNIDAQISYRESKRANPVITLHPYDPATYTNWRYYNGSYYEAASHQSLSRNGRNGFWVRLAQNANDTVTKGYSYTVEGHWEANAEP